MARGHAIARSEDHEWFYEVFDDTPGTWGVRERESRKVIGELLTKLQAEQLCIEKENEFRNGGQNGRK